MTLNKRKLKKLGESMWIHFTKEQERMILERFSTEPEPYEWSEQDIVVQIQNYLGCGEFVKSIQNTEGSTILSLDPFMWDEDCGGYSECQCDIQHRSTKNTAPGNEKYSSCQAKIQHVARDSFLVSEPQCQANSHPRQLKITAPSDLVIAFKQSCDASNVSMTEKLSQYMAEYSKTHIQKPVQRYMTKRQRRAAIKHIIKV